MGWVSRETSVETGSYPERCSKPLIKGLRGVEDAGQHKVEQGPQLPQAVLDGRPCQQDPVSKMEAAQNLSQPALGVLQAMALIHNQKIPLYLQHMLKLLLVLQIIHTNKPHQKFGCSCH